MIKPRRRHASPQHRRRVVLALCALALLATQWLGMAHRAHVDAHGPAPGSAQAADIDAGHGHGLDALFGHAAGDEACKLFDLAASVDLLAVQVHAVDVVPTSPATAGPPRPARSAERTCVYQARAPPDLA